MLRVTRVVYALTLSVMIATSARPVAAQTVQECYRKVLDWCSVAMEDANWLQKFAIGELCAFMIAGCTTANLINLK